MKPDSYAAAGVDVGRGERFTDYIRSLSSSAVSPEIGGFAAGVPLDIRRYRDPRILSTTDGVGTKLLVARALDSYETIGIDLVAMCANDLLVCGAEPVSFLDYIACGHIDPGVLEAVMRGIVTGCERAGCTLSGGETAEMPDLYENGSFDLAGFCIGVVEATSRLPRLDSIQAGDAVFGLPSAGIHANGFTLARKVLPRPEWHLLLEPTRIYAGEMRELLETGLISGAAHVTGGGLEGNLARVLPDDLRAELSWDWRVPEVFDRIRRAGDISAGEMRRVFNMGVGIALVVPGERSDELRALARARTLDLMYIGAVAGNEATGGGHSDG